jgi:hypothetical protein
VIIDDDNEEYKRMVINEKGEKLFDINVDINFSSTYIDNYIAGRCKDDTYYIINRHGDMFNVSKYIKDSHKKFLLPVCGDIFFVRNNNPNGLNLDAGMFEITPKRR